MNPLTPEEALEFVIEREIEEAIERKHQGEQEL